MTTQPLLIKLQISTTNTSQNGYITKDNISLVQQLLSETTDFVINSDCVVTAKKIAKKVVCFIDARGLACPVPLLKTKIALKKIDTDEYLYMVASDKNTLNDIQAFCKHANLKMFSNYVCTGNNNSYHFLVGK